jgi:hypothetical protein
MGFSALLFLTKILGGLNLPGLPEKVLAKLAEIQREFPDIKVQIDKLAEFIAAEVAPALADATNPGQILATIYGIARDLVTGTTGVDPGAWQDSV